MSKELAFARPDHTGGRIERLLISVAREIAQGMREAREICDSHGITLAQLEQMKLVPLFQRTLEDFAKEINATANVGKRIKLKAQYSAEQMLLSLHEIASDPSIPGVARVKAIELNAKIAGLLADSEGVGGGIQAGFVNIDLGGLMPATALTVRRADVVDLEAIEEEAAPVPGEDADLDAELADLLEGVDMVRARRLREAALTPGHTLTLEELNNGAAPVPGFETHRLHRPIEGRPAFGAETMVELNAHITLDAPEEPAETAPAPRIDEDLMAIQF